MLTPLQGRHRALNGGKWQLIQEFVEVESGKNNDRAELAKAMALCRLRNATLVIAKIDRLSKIPGRYARQRSWAVSDHSSHGVCRP
jgi:DNA invertase Pin-like site-specific DNA recombinase